MLLLVAAVIVAPLLLVSASALANDRPNIVLIVVDDMGFSDFGSFGGEIETPNIDALALAGARFSNFHVAASCAPTRAMLMTGVDSHLAGIGSMRELMPLSHRGKPGYKGVLNDRVQTVATVLQTVGYRTSVAGKWHLGVSAENLPAARGFAHSVIQADSGSDNFEMRPYLPMSPEANWYEGGERLSSLPEDFYSSSWFVDKAIEFLDQTAGDGSPFFSYLAFQANHTPLQAPDRFIDRYRGRYTEGWAQVRQARIERLKDMGLIAEAATLASGPSQEQWDLLSPEQQYFEARRMQVYAGMASAMDYELGRFLDYLRQTGHYDNTVFVLFSDNGAVANEPYENDFGRRWLEKNYHREVETLGAKGSWVAAGRHWGRVANTPLDGYKFFSREGGVRVPLVVAGLPLLEAGRVFNEFVYITDLAPTLLEVAGIEPPSATGLEPMTGKSLLPLLVSAAGPVHDASEAIGYEFSGNSALYRGDYKLVRNRPPVGDGHWRLYQISADPGETSDLSEQHPELYRELVAEYGVYAERAGVLEMPEDYSLARTVAINALLFVYLPRYLPAIGAALLLLAAVWFGYRFKKIRRRG